MLIADVLRTNLVVHILIHGFHDIVQVANIEAEMGPIECAVHNIGANIGQVSNLTNIGQVESDPDFV